MTALQTCDRCGAPASAPERGNLRANWCPGCEAIPPDCEECERASAVEARSRAVLREFQRALAEILAACGGDEDAAADRIAAQTGFLRSYALVLVREVLP